MQVNRQKQKKQSLKSKTNTVKARGRYFTGNYRTECIGKAKAELDQHYPTLKPTETL